MTMVRTLKSLLPLAAVAALAPGLVAAQDLDGAELYNTTCSACHAEGGLGTPGFAPPLARPDFWAGLGDQAVPYISGVMASGLSGTLTIDGQLYAGLLMPPMHDASPEELAAVATYVLQEFGGQTAEVTAEDVTAAREAAPGHADLRAMRPGS
ncbi:cytochrome c (plasmid) [Salipiger sp. H15]|uniref:Cytochrome c n=1 Tax=Alloyangia sp. H15 TaxID=3029062 RepID=A0AAU8AQM4_9RHOB